MMVRGGGVVVCLFLHEDQTQVYVFAWEALY